MSTKSLILERLQEDLSIKVYAKQMLNEVFTGNKTGENEYEWNIDNKKSIKDKATEYFNKIKSKYDSLAPNAKKKLKATALASVIGLIGLNGGIDKEKPLDATKTVIKQDIEQIADKILPVEKLPVEKLPDDIYIVATTLVGEAGGEGGAGMRAVANVLRNRAKATGKSIDDIALERKQFSMWNSHTIGGNDIDSVHKRYVEDAYPNNDKVWRRAVNIAKYIHTIEDNTDGATSYYNPSKVKPEWGEGSEGWTSTKKIGKHLFGKDSTSRYESSSNKLVPQNHPRK